MNCGPAGYGSVFKISPTQTGWSATVLHRFTGGNDGANPYASLLLLEGKLYGTTRDGGSSGVGDLGDGVIFRIVPQEVSEP